MAFAVLLVWTAPSAAQQSPVKGSAAPQVLSLSTLVAEALSQFEAGHFSAALNAFDRALTHAVVDEQKASLHYNAGACLLELQRPAEAEARFLQMEKLSAAQSVVARLQAGLAAIAAGALECAKLHRRAASPRSEIELQLAEQLQRAIGDIEVSRAEEQLASQRAQRLGKGYRLLDESKLEEAEQSFLAIAALQPSDSQQADALYGLALIAHRRGRFAAALRAIEQSLSFESTRFEPYWLRGAVYVKLEKPLAAKTAWQTALQLQPSTDVRAQLLVALQALDPRPPAGISGSLLLAGGYDSNATQSGAAQAVGLASSGEGVVPETDSPVVQGQVLLAATQRVGEQTSLREQLLLGTGAMTRSAVRDYSLNQVELSFRAGYHARPWLELWTSVAAGHFRSGLLAAQPFLSLLRFSVGGMVSHAAHFQTRLGSDYEVVRDLQSSSALTGYRLRAFASESFLANRGSVELGVEALLNSARSEELPADGSLFPRCASSRIAVQIACDTLRFSVPLSYRAAGAHLDLNYSWLSSLLLEGSVSYQYRSYSQPSQLLAGQAGIVLPGSETLRRDHTFDAGLGLFWGPEILGDWALWLSHQSRVAVSNLRPNLDDPEHRFDYEDRNYVQHRVLAGLRLGL